MEKTRLIFWVAALLALHVLGTGCGKKYSGRYNLTETQAGMQNNYNYSGTNSTATACQTSQVLMDITENGDSLSGNASNSCFTQTLTAKTGTDRMDNVTLTLVPVNQMQYSGTTTATQTCVYAGNLSMPDNQVSGTLILQGQTSAQPAPTPAPSPDQQQPGYPTTGQYPNQYPNYNYSQCATSIGIVGSYTN